MNWFNRVVKLTLLIPALSTWFLTPIASAQTQTPAKTTSPEPQDLDSTKDGTWASLRIYGSPVFTERSAR
jgi:hypothetical protein